MAMWYALWLCGIFTKIQNTNNLFYIENNKTLSTGYFSKVNMYNTIQLFTIKLI